MPPALRPLAGRVADLERGAPGASAKTAAAVHDLRVSPEVGIHLPPGAVCEEGLAGKSWAVLSDMTWFLAFEARRQIS